MCVLAKKRLVAISKEAISALIFTQHLICLEALNSSKVQNLAKWFNAIFLWDVLSW